MSRLLGGRYRLVSRLGQGGMASVYLARDERLLREVAVKLIRDYDNEDDIFLFHREARAIAALQHQNIVNILDYSGPEEDPAYIVMELIRGQSLEQLRLYRDFWPVPVIMAVLRGVAAALASAHDGGIVHRDIKAANIMLDHSGRVVLTDFGLAKAYRNPELLGQTMVGRQTGLSGTPEYLAPEQVLGEKCNEKVDIFSLGTLMYLLASGQLPFHKNSTVATMRAIAVLEYLPLSRLDPTLDPQLLRLVAMCLRREPGRRPMAVWLWQQADEWLSEHGWNSERIIRAFLADNDCTALKVNPPGQAVTRKFRFNCHKIKVTANS